MSYDDRTHRLGRIWLTLVILTIMAVPAILCIYYNAWPPISGVLRGLLGVIPIFWTISVIEVFTYVPMLGTGGTYITFVTGNLTNLKIPCALNAMKAAKVEPGSEEGDIITTISVAVSSIVTMVIIAAGVFLLRFVEPVINNPVLAPAFSNILPALFGALAVVYISQNLKISIVPVVFMISLFVFLPKIANFVGAGTLVPVGALVAIVSARIMYKKGWLDKEYNKEEQK